MPSITSQHLGDMVFETQIGRHKILNDVAQNPEFGGKDRYPTPPDYFIASLSSCVAAYVVQYCNQAKLDASGLLVTVAYEKETKPAHLRDITINVTLPNAELGDRLEAIKRVSSHCTVHETISRLGDIAITVTDRKDVTSQ